MPSSRFDALARNPVDRFIFATLQAKGLTPSPPADKRTLLRRVTLDLTGVPPTPGELTAFENDTSPNAYEKVVNACALPRPTASGGRGTGSTSFVLGKLRL